MSERTRQKHSLEWNHFVLNYFEIEVVFGFKRIKKLSQIKSAKIKTKSL